MPEGGSSVSVVEVGVNICVGEGSTVAVEVGAKNGVGVAVRDNDSVAVCVADGSTGGVEVGSPDVGVGDDDGRSVGGALVEVSSAVGV